MTRCYIVIGFVSLVATCLFREHSSGEGLQREGASISGTVVNYAGGAPYRQPNLRMYLFDWIQSKPLRDLQRKCREAARRGAAAHREATEACGDAMDEAIDLAAKLRNTATTKTDRKGLFRFGNIPPGRRYFVVGPAILGEGGETFVNGITPVLKPGQKVTIDLSTATPWTEPVSSHP